MLDDKKSKDLLRGTMTDLGVGLLYCADFQFSARIPLPTRYAGHPPPRGRGFSRHAAPREARNRFSRGEAVMEIAKSDFHD